jgi:glycosyltransferase involved in cell wall biosynthesis
VSGPTDRPVRVLHVLNHVRAVGNGIVNVAVDLACTQADKGHAVAVASEGGEYTALLEAHGVRHYVLPPRRARGALALARCLSEAIDTFAPEIVHAHMMTGMVLARILRGRRRYRLVSHIHNIHQRSSILMGLAERVIPVSEAVVRSMSWLGLPKRRMRVVQNAVAGGPRIGAEWAESRTVVERPSIVTVCGLSERKGITELIAAFERVTSRHPTAQLYIVGHGPDRGRFEARADASSVRRQIHFEGFQSNPEPYLKAADVFVLASRRESCGLAILEARAARCAIVATDVDGIPEQLDGGRAGLLVPPADPTALAGAIGRLLDDPSERARLAAAGANFSDRTVAAMTDQVVAVYRELL